MADVMPYVRLMLLPVLLWKILYHMGRCYYYNILVLFLFRAWLFMCTGIFLT